MSDVLVNRLYHVGCYSMLSLGVLRAGFDCILILVAWIYPSILDVDGTAQNLAYWASSMPTLNFSRDELPGERRQQLPNLFSWLLGHLII